MRAQPGTPPMINARDLIMLGLMFGAMAVSFMWPQVGMPLQEFPTLFMMVMLFMSFLSISLKSIGLTAREHGRRLLGWLFLKLIVLPIVLYFLVRLIYPEYALAALLLGGISSGVVAPFFSTLLRANTSLVILMVTTSSILVPVTLPTLVRVLAGQTLDIPFILMARILAQVILVPLVAAEIVRSVLPSVASRIVSNRYLVSLALCAGIVLGVFSRYAGYLHENPMVLLHALLAAALLAALFFTAGILISIGQHVADRLAALISLGLINNILIVVFSSQFFGLIEPLVAMVYTIPFFGSIVFLRAYNGFLMRDRTTMRPSRQQLGDA
jgi:bile acid:Na+ symporter, BASS family